ncbi:MAG: IS110 family transposase, partial [Crenarchaeota archaeon]|nr:IS110 family transposase [Thermoproteota archaeon]
MEDRIEILANKNEVKVVSSVPDVGKRSTAAILAEIGDVIWLSNGKQIASWTGLAPSL